MLRASTPGGHPLIRLAWLGAGLALLGAAGLAAVGSPGMAARLLGLAAVLLAAGFAAYLARHAAFIRAIARADAARLSGDLVAARAILAPLFARHPGVAALQRSAADVLYESGDPLSASSLYERAIAALGPDPDLVVGLVASYAALNKAGDARRAAALAPRPVDVRLALAWSELVALAGDRTAGADLAQSLSSDPEVASSPQRQAMAAALLAVSAAQRSDRPAVDRHISQANEAGATLSPADRGFLGYLIGVARRESGDQDGAISTFDEAIAAAPDTIGEALARRERANLLARLGKL